MPGLEDFGALPAGIGDDGSAQALAMASPAGPAALVPQAPMMSVAPTMTMAPPPTPAFNPATIDALYQAGKLTPEQYAGMGGKLAANAAPVATAPALAAQVSAAPTPQVGTNTPPAPPKGGVIFHPPPGAAQMQGEGGFALPGLSSGVNVPAGWVPQGRQMHTESGVQFSPETQAALGGATQAANEADLARAHAADAQTKFDATKAKIDAVQADADLAAYHVQQARQESAKNAQLDSINSTQREIDQANARGIDHHHWFANKSTGSKLAMAIGLIAGGFNQGIHGGSNPMLDLMNKEIDRDVEDQKESLAGKERSLSNKVSVYGMLRQKGLDENAASDAARLLAHQALDAQMKAAAPGVTSALGQVALKQAIAENQAKLAQLRASLDEKASSRSATSTSEAFRPAQSGVGAVTPLTILQDAKKLYEQHRGEPGNTWESAVRDAVRGRTGHDIMPGAPEPIIGKANVPNAGRLAKPMLAATANIAKLQELEKLANKTYLNGEEKARANQILADAKAAGIQGLPEDIGRLDVGRLTGAVQAAVNQAKKGEQTTLGAARDIMANGGAGGGGDEAADPEGFQEE